MTESYREAAHRVLDGLVSEGHISTLNFANHSFSAAHAHAVTHTAAVASVLGARAAAGVDNCDGLLYIRRKNVLSA